MDTDQPGHAGAERSAANKPGEFYDILVQGQIDSLWEQWFPGMALSYVENGDSGLACTRISGWVIDQPALLGLLIKLRDLNLKLLSVRRISPRAISSEEIDIFLT